MTDAGPRIEGELNLSEARVLIVDDSRSARSMLERFMKWAGIGHIEFAANGAEGLQKLERFRPDLVLLDVAMPEMDGHEMCRRLRTDPRYLDLPIIFQTALTSDQNRVACFEAGGSDIILKPLNYGESIARVRLHLEKQHMVRELKAFRSRVEQDLMSARGMQLSLIPRTDQLTTLGEKHGLRLSAFFEPSSELGGDFWALFEVSETAIGVLVTDFSGHGIPAAINTFRLHTLIERRPPRGVPPADWLRWLAADLKELLPLGHFATAFYAVIDTAARTLTYAGAGHPSPFLITPDGHVPIDSAGLFLGIVRDAVYVEHTVALPERWSLLIYSDALTESPDRDGEMLGEDGVQAIATAVARETRADPLDDVLQAFFAAGRRPLDDDLTVLWIEPAR